MAKPRNYRKEYDTYQGTPEQKKNRAKRNRARRLMIQKHGKAAVKGKDIDHVNGNPQDNRMSNLRITSKHFNRAKH